MFHSLWSTCHRQVMRQHSIGARRSLTTLLATSVLTASAALPLLAPVADAAPTTTQSTQAARILRLTNAERAKVGCGALVEVAKLDRAAQKHSVYQNEIQTMTHTGRGGTDPGQRITAEGYVWRTYGENVAYGYGTADAVMTAWMNSPGHRANILNCKFKEMGIGLEGSKNYWTQDFGARS